MADMAKEHPDCAYCAKGELVKKFGYEICELPASTVYLFKEQSHPGRCIVASKHHVSEMLSSARQIAQHLSRMSSRLQMRFMRYATRTS